MAIMEPRQSKPMETSSPLGAVRRLWQPMQSEAWANRAWGPSVAGWAR